MVTKISWSYDQSLDCEVAHCGDYRIRAERDDSPTNLFTDWDGHWPMMVRYDRTTTTYDKMPGACLDDVLERFNDELLVHYQKHIAKALEADQHSDVRYHMGDVELLDGDAPAWVTEAPILRDWFDEALRTCNEPWFDELEVLYGLLGIPCINTSSQGYCQRDYAELLIVATPEAQEQLFSRKPEMSDEEWKAAIDENLQAQVDLYSAWAWGDVYGYIVEKFEPDEDGDDEHNEVTGDWVEIPDGACWGFYGSDHNKSGLEAAALECLPEDVTS